MDTRNVLIPDPSRLTTDFFHLLMSYLAPWTVSVRRHSPLPVRRPANPYKESKPPNNRLSVAVRAQQRHSPRGPNGDRSKASKVKEKKESKEGKEAAGKAKDDKVETIIYTADQTQTAHPAGPVFIQVTGRSNVCFYFSCLGERSEKV